MNARQFIEDIRLVTDYAALNLRTVEQVRDERVQSIRDAVRRLQNEVEVQEQMGVDDAR